MIYKNNNDNLSFIINGQFSFCGKGIQEAKKYNSCAFKILHWHSRDYFTYISNDIAVWNTEIRTLATDFVIQKNFLELNIYELHDGVDLNTKIFVKQMIITNV